MAFTTAAFQKRAFQNNAFQVGTTGDGAGRIVAQTSATLLVVPLSRRRYEEILAEKQARLDAWNALTPLQRLNIELEEFTEEFAELRDFSNQPWAQQRAEELEKLIAQTKFKIERWELAAAYTAARKAKSRH
jgi:hypothetical protein